MRKLQAIYGAAALILTTGIAQRSMAEPVVYTDQATFQSQLSSYAYDNFSTYTSAESLGYSLNYSQNGFSANFTASQHTPGDDDLWSAPGGIGNPGELTTDDSLDVITITFSPNVYAVGGDFYVTDINGNVLPYFTVYVNLEDGSSQLLNLDASDGIFQQSDPLFHGYVSSVPIASLTVFDDSRDNAWATIDNFYFGDAGTAASPVPLPASVYGGLGLLGLMVGLNRLRRQKAAI